MIHGFRVDKTLGIKIIRVIVIIEILAVLMGVKDYFDYKNFTGAIGRPPSGESELTKELKVSSELGDRDVSVNVSPIKRDRKEIETLIEGAKKEIDESFLGKNNDFDSITDDVEPKDSYQNGVVKAEWQFDNYKVINPSGKIQLENIMEDTVVRCEARLSVEDYEENYIFSVVLITPDVKSERGYSYLLNKSIKEADREEKSNSRMTLPKSVGGMVLKWSPKENFRSVKMALFGLVSGILIVFADREDKRKQKNNHKKLLEEDYPEIVSMLSLYVGAGISVKGAVKRIASSYRNKLFKTGEKRPGFEGICVLERSMEDGKGEIESYKEFGKRMEHKDYRKLSIILVQNLRKGTSQLIKQLESEEQNAFDERKLRAKIAGEEASTKLLLPMMCLLGIVLVVLVFPAIQGIGI